jgi:hypothetical protein
MLMRTPGSEAEYAPGRDTFGLGSLLPPPVTRSWAQEM